MNDNDDSIKDGAARRRGSLVWQYFEKLSGVRVKCRICQHEQRYMGNTANALRHLKAKHDIDARAIGLSDPENVKRMKALTAIGIPFEPTAISAVNVKNECNFFDEHKNNEEKEKDDEEGESFTKHSRSRPRLHLPDSDTDIDPYENNEEPLVDFLDTSKIYSSKDNEDEEFSHNRNTKSGAKRKRSQYDERIQAEIEYLREKTGYFRIQKHLTALQAKKVKFELEQLYEK